MTALPDPASPMCSSGKRGYRTERNAATALSGAQHLRAQKNVGRRPGVVEAGYYECPVCHWWHLCSTTGRTRRAAARKSTTRRH